MSTQRQEQQQQEAAAVSIIPDDEGSSGGDDVTVVVSYVPLLSGALDECLAPGDATCIGGIASVAALQRYYHAQQQQQDDGTATSTSSSSTLMLPYIDKTSPFVQIHPLQWALNRLVLGDLLQCQTLLSSPALLTQNSRDYDVSLRDLTGLQSSELPVLLTNVVVPPYLSWYGYTRAVHWDVTTHLAVLAVDQEASATELRIDPVAAVRGVLDWVTRVNRDNGCRTSANVTDDMYTLYAQNLTLMIESDGTTPTTTPPQQQLCWVPIIVFADTFTSFVQFLTEITRHEHPPALIFDVLGTDSTYEVPTLHDSNNVTWVHSSRYGSDTYQQLRLFLSRNNNSINQSMISRIELLQLPFVDMPDEAKDLRYVSDLTYLRTLADQAVQNDPVVGQTLEMPVHRNDDASEYRRCNAGECPLGNLFTDALRWFTGTHVAFVTSGGLRGPGWPAGNVRVSDLWTALPFANTQCTGVMSGVNLFRLFNYSTTIATFEGESTDTGGELLQFSGMRITYNTELPSPPTRLLNMDIWDDAAQQYRPLERLQLYHFATDSFLCDTNDPYPELLVSNLIMEDEEPGVIGSHLVQDIVALYLGQRNTTYDTKLQGKMTNDTSRTDALVDVVQTADGCDDTLGASYWDDRSWTCTPCPVDPKVRFLQLRVELEGVTGSSDAAFGHIELINGELFAVVVRPKSIPSWIELTGTVSMLHFEEQNRSSSGDIAPSWSMEAGEGMTLHFQVFPASLSTGTAVATVLFGVVNDGKHYLGCNSPDVGFDVFLKVTPVEDLNQLGPYAALGLALAALVSMSSIYFMAFAYRKRNETIVKTMQPVFLVAICGGVFVMGLSIVPLSLDDGLVSEQGADRACMSVLWLFSMGFTIAQSALFSKLWRINKLFDVRRMHRMQIFEKDVAWPGLVLFVLNFTLLLIYTLVDPLRYERETVSGEDWNSYGHCTNGTAGRVLFALNLTVNLSALSIACYQAFKARNISDEFSESKSVAFALFSWLELMLVALPAVFLIDDDNPIARYFMYISLVFAGK